MRASEDTEVNRPALALSGVSAIPQESRAVPPHSLIVGLSWSVLVLAGGPVAGGAAADPGAAPAEPRPQDTATGGGGRAGGSGTGGSTHHTTDNGDRQHSPCSLQRHSGFTFAALEPGRRGQGQHGGEYPYTSPALTTPAPPARPRPGAAHLHTNARYDRAIDAHTGTGRSEILP